MNIKYLYSAKSYTIHSHEYHWCHVRIKRKSTPIPLHQTNSPKLFSKALTFKESKTASFDFPKNCTPLPPRSDPDELLLRNTWSFYSTNRNISRITHATRRAEKSTDAIAAYTSNQLRTRYCLFASIKSDFHAPMMHTYANSRQFKRA